MKISAFLLFVETRITRWVKRKRTLTNFFCISSQVKFLHFVLKSCWFMLSWFRVIVRQLRRRSLVQYYSDHGKLNNILKFFRSAFIHSQRFYKNLIFPPLRNIQMHLFSFSLWGGVFNRKIHSVVCIRCSLEKIRASNVAHRAVIVAALSRARYILGLQSAWEHHCSVLVTENGFNIHRSLPPFAFFILAKWKLGADE